MNVNNQLICVSETQWTLLVPMEIPEEKLRARVARFTPISIELIDTQSYHGYQAVRLADPLRQLRMGNIKNQFLGAVLAPAFCN